MPLAPDLDPRLEPSDALRGRLDKPYRASEGLLTAANVALKLERPLLLTGDPGCGKTDFAWAAAHALGQQWGYQGRDLEPLCCYVRSDSRARDLLYRHDTVRRFGDAQHGGKEGLERAADPRNYIDLQPLGEALASSQRRVVLIDEIDKAPRDLPNDLLRELDRNSFEIPEIPEKLEGERSSRGIALRRLMHRPRNAAGKRLPAPLVVITSNIERQLPDAFLRRCVFWHIDFPRDQLVHILSDHFPELAVEGASADAEVANGAVALFGHLYERRDLVKTPATAELIDWVSALLGVFERGLVRQRIGDAATELEDSGGLDWSRVPGLECLIKLREDRETVCGTT